jgi:hypothetical protein
MGFRPLQRMRKSGFGRREPGQGPATFRPQRFARSRRLAPRPSVRALSRASAPTRSREPAPGAHRRGTRLARAKPASPPPGNAPGVPPTGSCSSRGSRPLSRPPALLPFPSPHEPLSARDDGRLQSLAPPGNPFRARPKTRARPIPSWRWPSRALPPTRRGRGDRPRRPIKAPRSSFRCLLPCRFASRRAASESSPPGGPGISSSRRRRPFWGFPPRPARTALRSPRWFR